MTYQQTIVRAMNDLALKKDVSFIGQGITTGDRVYGTMAEVDTNKCLELPCAENLHMGMAMGMSLRGLKPIVIFHRMDFTLIAADAIINHLALLPKMSGGQFTLPVMIRVIVGQRDSKFKQGIQHNKDFSYFFENYMNVYRLLNDSDIQYYYELAYNSNEPSMLVEYKDLYDAEEIRGDDIA